MRTQTAGGKLLAETLAVSLAARLVHSYSGLSPDKDLEQLSHQVRLGVRTRAPCYFPFATFRLAAN